MLAVTSRRRPLLLAILRHQQWRARRYQTRCSLRAVRVGSHISEEALAFRHQRQHRCVRASAVRRATKHQLEVSHRAVCWGFDAVHSASLTKRASDGNCDRFRSSTFVSFCRHDCTCPRLSGGARNTEVKEDGIPSIFLTRLRGKWRLTNNVMQPCLKILPIAAGPT